MSNFKTDPQLPPEERLRKRGGIPIARGYRSSVANGLFSIYADLSAAPSASGVADGSPVLVPSGSSLNMYVAVSGSYLLIES